MKNRKIINRKKKKAFTLIELLAVILILGIIALIAVPTVNNVIEDSKKGSIKTTATNLSQVAEQQCEIERINGKDITNIYTIEDGVISSYLDIKNLPSSGTIIVDDECNVTVSVVDGNYCATVEGETVNVNTNILHCGGEYVDVPKTDNNCFEFDPNTRTITGYKFDDATCPTEISIPATIDNVPVEHIGDLAFVNIDYDAIAYYAYDSRIWDFIDIKKENILKYSDYSIYGFDFVDYLVEEPKKNCYLADGTRVELGIDYVLTDEDVSKYTQCMIDESTITYVSDVGVITKVNFAPATNLKTIGMGAFMYNQITEVIFKDNDNLSSIGLNAFSDNLISGELDLSNLKLISVGGFNYNNITKVILSDTVTTLSEFAFADNFIEEIQFGSNISVIDTLAFWNNLLHGSIILPDTVTRLGIETFGNNNIENVEINDKLQYISPYAFNSNELLSSVTFGDSVENIGIGSFFNTAIESLDFNENLKKIELYAFSYSKLSKINFNSNLESIGQYAFSYNTSTIDNLVLPDKLTLIDWNTFRETKINNLTVGNNITEIKGYAFTNCDIQNITWGSSLKTIGEYAFQYNSLSELNFNTNLESIGTYAFSYNNLSSINFNDNLKVIGVSSFRYNTATIDNLVLPDKLTAIEVDAFCKTKINNLTIGKNIVEIKEEAFTNCDIQNITWGSSLKTIGKNSFRSNNLSTFNLPDGLTTIGSGAFQFSYQNIDNTIVTLPESLEYVGYSAFLNINGSNLERINIGSKVKSIEVETFFCWCNSNCDSICGLTIYIDQLQSESSLNPTVWGNDYITVIWKESSE